LGYLEIASVGDCLREISSYMSRKFWERLLTKNGGYQNLPLVCTALHPYTVKVHVHNVSVSELFMTLY